MGRFDEVMVSHTDEELVAIASSVDDEYVPDAVAAANRELAKRGLSPVALHAAKEKVEAQTTEKEKRANEPLESHKAVTTFLLSLFGVVGVLFFLASSTDLVREGYTRKAREQRKYAMWGTGTLVALILGIGIAVSTCSR